MIEHNRKESFSIRQAWREIYSMDLKNQTGKWKLPDFEWHTFSGGYSKCKNGAKSEEYYRNQVEKNFFVMFEESERLLVLEIVNGQLPQLNDLRGNDIYIYPKDMNWTMAFTHEESMGLGPYFSMKDWQTSRENGES